MRVDYKYDNYHTLTSQFSSNVNIQTTSKDSAADEKQSNSLDKSESSTSEESSDAPLHLQKHVQPKVQMFSVPQR